MAELLIEQLRFTRSEWLRGLEGLSPEEAERHVGPMNSIAWIVGHLGWQEHAYWLERAQDKSLYPEIGAKFGYGAPMSTPSLEDTLEIWRRVVEASEAFLDGLDTEMLESQLLYQGRSVGQTIGSAFLRMIYHYWYHIGEIQAIRQMLAHDDLPEFIGRIEQLAPYRAAPHP